MIIIKNKFKRKLLLEKYPLRKEDMFLEITNDFCIKSDEETYPDTLFFFVCNRNIFQYELTTGNFYCSFHFYWSIFEKEYELNYNEIQSFTKNMVEKHFKLKELIPILLKNHDFKRVEEHFKTKKLRPRWTLNNRPNRVEEHFNLKELTPNKNCKFSRTNAEEHFKSKE